MPRMPWCPPETGRIAWARNEGFPDFLVLMAWKGSQEPVYVSCAAEVVGLCWLGDGQKGYAWVFGMQRTATVITAI